MQNFATKLFLLNITRVYLNKNSEPGCKIKVIMRCKWLKNDDFALGKVDFLSKKQPMSTQEFECLDQ